MGKKKDDDIIVSFIGNNAENVAGSCITVSYKKDDGMRGVFLLELGSIQGGMSVLDEFNSNKKLIEKIPVKDLEFVIIAHSHYDHIGNLGALIPSGFKGDIISTFENYELSRKMLVDGANVHKKNVEYLNRKGSKVKALYTEQDIYSILDRFELYDIDNIHHINENISFRFRKNSHITGATQVEIFIKKLNGTIKKIVYTSDLGSKVNRELNPFVEDADIIKNSNLFICEGTYGESLTGFTKRDLKNELKDFKKTIIDFVKSGNRVFIPAFSLVRSQNLMCLIYELMKDEEWFKDIPVVIDSNLTNEINSVYFKILSDNDKDYWKEVMSWKNFKFIKDYQSSIAFLSQRTPSVCLSASGMVNAGRSVLYAKSFLNNSNDCIIFCGYCSPESVGGKILDTSKDIINIDGSTLIKRCTIKRYYCFSSHAQAQDIIDYIKQINTDKVIIHHASKKAKEVLIEESKKQLSEISKTTMVVGVGINGVSNQFRL